LDQPVNVIYVPRDSRLAGGYENENTRKLFLDADGPDAPWVFDGNKIDIGAVAEEFFELTIDLYPRKPGALFKAIPDTPEGDGAESVFSIVERLKQS